MFETEVNVCVFFKLVHAKVNCDGYKEQGITFPSGPMQKRLLLEFYEECNVDPATVDFLEAHATGTFDFEIGKVGHKNYLLKI